MTRRWLIAYVGMLLPLLFAVAGMLMAANLRGAL